jgi:hypothetical protein
MPVRERVSFVGEAAKPAGHLFLPDPAGSDPAGGGTEGPVVGVVVAGTWTSVKEQTADRYAEEPTRRGYAAPAFDFTGYGESQVEPRDYESPALKVRDLRAAADFLSAHPVVDAGQWGVLGVYARGDVRECLRRRGRAGRVAGSGSAVAARPPYLRGELRRAGGRWDKEGGGGTRRPARSPMCRWSTAATQRLRCPSASTSTSARSAAAFRSGPTGMP